MLALPGEKGEENGTGRAGETAREKRKEEVTR